MKKGTLKYSIISAICAVLFVGIAIVAPDLTGGDMLLPSMDIEEGMLIWYVLLLCLAAEAVAVKFLFKETYLKTAAVTLFMNLVSTVLGAVALHLAGLIIELLFFPFPFGTYHITHWIVNFIGIIFLNALLEGFAIKIAFKYKFKKIYWRLFLVNAISLVICILCNLPSWISSIFLTY